VIVDGLADPLQPVVAVALSSTCLGLRTPLRAALEVLKERHELAKALCRQVNTQAGGPHMTCVTLRDANELHWSLSPDNVATLGMILRTRGLPSLKSLSLNESDCGDVGVQGLCACLGDGSMPSLHTLDLACNPFWPLGAEAIAAALRRGAMPKLMHLYLYNSKIGDQGLTALGAPLRKMPALRNLRIWHCSFGDEGVASLFANLGKDDFTKLEYVDLSGNDDVTDKSCACLVAALDSDALPRLNQILFSFITASGAAQRAVQDALARRLARRAS